MVPHKISISDNNNAHIVFVQVEDLADSCYETLNLEEVLTLEQRLHEPGMETKNVGELYPKHKHLMVRQFYWTLSFLPPKCLFPD